jgi:tetratricopeptide (TPR) repeat protein
MQTKNQNLNDLFQNTLGFFLKNKFYALIIGGGVVLIALLLGFSLFNQNSKNEKANKIYDQAIFYIHNIQSISTNEEEKNKIFQEQINSLSMLSEVYAKTTASIRAELYLGRLFYEQANTAGKAEAMNQAISYYTKAYENSRSGFYKALALLGRGECFEQKNDLSKAFDDYQTVFTKFPKEGFNATALIAMARTKEMAGGGDINSALAYYRQLIKEYPSSLWTKYAKGKLYFYADTSKNKSPIPSSKLPLILPN